MGKELGRCSLRTAAPETQLRAVPEENAVAPDRLCHIRLQYTDESGILKPLKRGILNVEVSGGKLLGLGSACPVLWRKDRHLLWRSIGSDAGRRG